MGLYGVGKFTGYGISLNSLLKNEIFINIYDIYNKTTFL